MLLEVIYMLENGMLGGGSVVRSGVVYLRIGYARIRRFQLNLGHPLH